MTQPQLIGHIIIVLFLCCTVGAVAFAVHEKAASRAVRLCVWLLTFILFAGIGAALL